MSCLFLLCFAACVEPRLHITLASGDAITEDLATVGYYVHLEGANVKSFGPIDVNQGGLLTPADRYLTVTKDGTVEDEPFILPFDTRFFVDILGCPAEPPLGVDANGNRLNCSELTAVARGCTSVNSISADDPQKEINVPLVRIENSVCPPTL